MSSFHRVKTSLKKGKDKAGLLTTSIRRSFSPKPISEVAESPALIKHSVDPLQAGQMESLMATDDKAGAVIATRLGAAELLANVAEGPSVRNMPIIVVPEPDPGAVAQASLVPTTSPSTDSVVVSGAEYVMPSEQAALLNAPHAVGQAYVGPFAGSQNCRRNQIQVPSSQAARRYLNG
ncbi:hypothetical protein B0H34DRAFT_477830 [Crassisporium funariophilum]|nr:hypothetical protein B0H34DRAFT_477830 [Crassisporium funariophilum]